MRSGQSRSLHIYSTYLIQFDSYTYLIFLQAGGVFVDRAASAVLQLKLQESLYGSEEFVSEMIREFEKKVRPLIWISVIPCLSLLFSPFHVCYTDIY